MRLVVHKVPYRCGGKDLIVDHVGERTVPGKRMGHRSLKPGTQRGREKDVQSEEEIAGRKRERIKEALEG